MGISYKRISPRILRAPCHQLPHQRQGSGSDSLSNHLMHAFQQRLRKSKIFLKGPPHKTGIFALFVDIGHARKDQEHVPSWTWQSRLSLHRKTCRLEHKLSTHHDLLMSDGQRRMTQDFGHFLPVERREHQITQAEVHIIVETGGECCN